MATQRTKWLRVLKPISPRANLIIGCLSFVVPILIWSLVSYVPWIWHPQIFITNPGSVDYLQAGMRMDKEAFANESSVAPELFDLCRGQAGDVLSRKVFNADFGRLRLGVLELRLRDPLNRWGVGLALYRGPAW